MLRNVVEDGSSKPLGINLTVEIMEEVLKKDSCRAGMDTAHWQREVIVGVVAERCLAVASALEGEAASSHYAQAGMVVAFFGRGIWVLPKKHHVVNDVPRKPGALLEWHGRIGRQHVVPCGVRLHQLEHRQRK